MFRDESTKVIQKAHASWGHDPSDASRSSDSSPTSPSSSNSSVKGSPRLGVYPDKSSPSRDLISARLPKLPGTIDQTKAEQGIQFYLEHYIMGHPDEPKSGEEMRRRTLIDVPVVSEAMAAVGLAGLSNLYGSAQLQRMSQHHYGLSRQHTMKALQNLDGVRVEQLTRTVIMLAMFEVIPNPVLRRMCWNARLTAGDG